LFIILNHNNFYNYTIDELLHIKGKLNNNNKNTNNNVIMTKTYSFI